MNKFIYIFLSTYLIFVYSSSNAQSMGFGCLGLSGFYAGYSQQQFDAKNLNKIIPNLSSFSSNVIDFNSSPIKFQKTTGYRVGANIFRANFESVFISAKGYYQFLKDKQTAVGSNPAKFYKEDYQLEMNHWGVGLDFGVPLFWIFDLKLIEANLTFFNVELSKQAFVDNVLLNEMALHHDKNKMGYFLGSGIIVNIIPDYMSIEGTAGYNFYDFDSLTDDNQNLVNGLDSENKAIQKGGFSATVQLNLGFPL